MHRFIVVYVFATTVLVAVPSAAQNVATGTATIPAPARSEGTARTAQPGSAEPINYETARLERRITAVRASGNITLDGSLDEAVWREAPIANGFIQNDPREGTPATYDTEVRVLYNDDALYFGVW